METSLVQWIAAAIFAVAVLHTFSVKHFERLAHRFPNHAGVLHFMAEVEAVFGFWAMVLVLYLAVVLTPKTAIDYVQTRNYTEPMFVFVVMVIAGSKPIVELVRWLVLRLIDFIPVPAVRRSLLFYFFVLSVVPLTGSLITEPAAMTLGAMMLRDQIFLDSDCSLRTKYLTVGTLFVNISVGGVLTSFAAPPVLMVASTWGWDSRFMFTNFGLAACAITIVNAAIAAASARADLLRVELDASPPKPATPWGVILISAAFLAAAVLMAHYAAVFMGIFLFFLGFATAYRDFQDRLILREALMVAFFLSGLVVLGGLQAWWLKPLLSSLSPDAVYFGATGLTAITDNAALTYLASLVPGLSDEFKYMVVAGAVTGGGLTVIANAPNPAGYSIMRGRFPDEVIAPGKLFLAALLPTVVAIVFLWGAHKVFVSPASGKLAAEKSNHKGSSGNLPGKAIPEGVSKAGAREGNAEAPSADDLLKKGY